MIDSGATLRNHLGAHAYLIVDTRHPDRAIRDKSTLTSRLYKTANSWPSTIASQSLVPSSAFEGLRFVSLIVRYVQQKRGRSNRIQDLAFRHAVWLLRFRK